MPQEFYVLRCFSCENYQVHIVKKNKKWQCKVCNEKQSVTRNFGKGDSKACRNIVMKLNELVRTKMFQHDNERSYDKPSTQNDLTVFKLHEYTDVKISKGSKWLQYLDEEEFESDEETTEITEIISNDCNQFKNNAKKRKIIHETNLSEDVGTSNITNQNSSGNEENNVNLNNQFVNTHLVDSCARTEVTEPVSNNPDMNIKKIKKRKFDDSVTNKNDSQKVYNINYQKNIFSPDPNDLDEIMNINF